MYDLIIIGAGPAGMTAAIYAARRKVKFLILSLDLGGQMGWSSKVENYPGVKFMTGIELTQQFQENMANYKIIHGEQNGKRRNKISNKSKNNC